MATSQNTPATSLVEFELAESDLVTTTLGEATKIGNDAWQYHWDLDAPTPVADGEYTLRAILYSGSGVTAIEVARDEMDHLRPERRSGRSPRSPPRRISPPSRTARSGRFLHDTRSVARRKRFSQSNTAGNDLHRGVLHGLGSG